MFECLPPLSPSIVDLMAYLKNYGFVGTPTEESQEESQEAAKIDQQIVKNRLSFGLALGRPSGPQKVSKNGPKMIQHHPN